MTTIDVTAEMERAAARALGYSFLAYTFAYPGEAIVPALLELARDVQALSDSPLQGLARAIEEAPREQLQETHTRLFTLSSSLDFPTFETAYYPGDPQVQTARMADIAGFYRAFGVEHSATGARPDDISVELEFMAFLCRKQIHARQRRGAPRVRQTIRAQRLFLTEHLGTWAAELGDRLAAGAGHMVYRLAGVALKEWVADDCRRLGAKPVAVSGETELGRADEFRYAPEQVARPAQLFSPDEIPVA